MAPRLTDIETDGWQLDDGEVLHQQHPDTFWIPPRDVRDALQPAQVVKLVFRIVTLGEDDALEENVERMWVIVDGREGDLYRGVLDNDPECTDELKSGSEVWFQARHVIAVYEAIDEDAFEDDAAWAD